MIRYCLIYLFVSVMMIFSFLMLKITLPYMSFEYDVDFLLTKQSVLHITAWRYSFYTHIISSIFVLLFGAFQFVPVESTKVIRVHRFLGKIYVFTVLFLSAPSGLIMGFYANGGIWSKTSFVIISVLWWYFTFMAYRKIVQKNIDAHKRFMYRSYALTLSAITLRIYVLVLPLVIHLHSKEMYTLVAWLSWVPNLLVVEFVANKKGAGNSANQLD